MKRPSTFMDLMPLRAAHSLILTLVASHRTLDLFFTVRVSHPTMGDTHLKEKSQNNFFLKILVSFYWKQDGAFK